MNENHEIIEIFPSLKLASKHMNVLNSYLCTRIKNNEKALTRHNRLHFIVNIQEDSVL